MCGVPESLGFIGGLGYIGDWGADDCLRLGLTRRLNSRHPQLETPLRVPGLICLLDLSSKPRFQEQVKNPPDRLQHNVLQVGDLLRTTLRDSRTYLNRMRHSCELMLSERGGWLVWLWRLLLEKRRFVWKCAFWFLDNESSSLAYNNWPWRSVCVMGNN